MKILKLIKFIFAKAQFLTDSCSIDTWTSKSDFSKNYFEHTIVMKWNNIDETVSEYYE